MTHEVVVIVYYLCKTLIFIVVTEIVIDFSGFVFILDEQ